MGWALMKVYENAPAYLIALSGGFLLVGPILCMGLYEVSRLLDQGERPTLGQAVFAWRRKLDTLAIFGFTLLVLELIWSRAALVVFAVSFDSLPDLGGSILRLLAPENLRFIVTFVAVGAVFATVIYSVSVVSIPMILDRQVDAIAAALTSLRLVLGQPGVMFFWAALLAGMLFASMLPWFVGLLVAGPVAGHASWHAYRAAVGDTTLPAARIDD